MGRRGHLLQQHSEHVNEARGGLPEAVGHPSRLVTRCIGQGLGNSKCDLAVRVRRSR